MKLAAQEIAQIVGGTLKGNGDISIEGVASIEEATAADISFINSPQYLKFLPHCQAGVLLVKNGLEIPTHHTVIGVPNAQFAFLKILQIFATDKSIREAIGIHVTALIAKDVQLGENISIGPYVVLESGVSIGSGTTIGAHSFIGRNSVIGKSCHLYPQVTVREEIRIGNQVTIHSGSVIGADGFGYFTEGTLHHKIPQIGIVEIEDAVEIGANVTIDRATMGKTIIGKGSKIDNLVQIAHNVRVGESCLIAAQSAIAGSSKLGKNVTLAGQVGVGDHVTIGDGSIVAAQSGIPKDVRPGSILFGTPAKPLLLEKKIQAVLKKLPAFYEEFRKIKKHLNLDLGHAKTKNN